MFDNNPWPTHGSGTPTLGLDPVSMSGIRLRTPPSPSGTPRPQDRPHDPSRGNTASDPTPSMSVHRVGSHTYRSVTPPPVRPCPVKDESFPQGAHPRHRKDEKDPLLPGVSSRVPPKSPPPTCDPTSRTSSEPAKSEDPWEGLRTTGSTGPQKWEWGE